MDLNAEYNWGNKKRTLINLQISRAREWVGQGQAWCLFSRSSQFNVEADVWSDECHSVCCEGDC